MMICVCARTSNCVCVWEYVPGTMWSGRSALWDRCPHLVLNYSSCQLACPPSPWKPLTKSFTPHPCGFTSSSPPRPSLPPLSLSPSLSPPWFVHLQPLSPSLLLSLFLTSPIFSSVFPLLQLFSISVFLISPELPLTHFLFLSPSFFSSCLSPCWHSLLCYPRVAD